MRVRDGGGGRGGGGGAAAVFCVQCSLGRLGASAHVVRVPDGQPVRTSLAYTPAPSPPLPPACCRGVDASGAGGSPAVAAGTGEELLAAVLRAVLTHLLEISCHSCPRRAPLNAVALSFCVAHLHARAVASAFAGCTSAGDANSRSQKCSSIKASQPARVAKANQATS